MSDAVCKRLEPVDVDEIRFFLFATDPTFFPMDYWTSRKIMRNIPEVQVVEKERKNRTN